MKPVSEIREQAQALFNDSMTALATDERFIVDEIERTIKTAAYRSMRRALESRMRAYPPEDTKPRKASR